MKVKIKEVATIAAMAVFTLYLATFASADDVNVEINVTEGPAFVNVTVQADDTEAREDIAEIQEDLYGEPHSDPEDTVMAGMEDDDEGYVVEICDDPELQQYFDEVSLLPPSEFKEHMKSLGYDDETHVNMIWNLCQHKYIQEHEGKWSEDKYNPGGILPHELIYYIKGAISWLKGETGTPEQFIEIGTALDSYFASDRDVAIIGNRVLSDIEMLKIRVEALEMTMERIAPDEFCQVKIEIMEKYGLVSVKCGEESTWYYMIPDSNSEKGYYIMGITPVDGNEQAPEELVCTEDWVCADWSECKNGLQLRVCGDKNNCGTTIDKPIEVRGCIESVVEIEPKTEVLPSLSGMLATLNNVSPYPIFIVLFAATPIVLGTIMFRTLKTQSVKLRKAAGIRIKSLKSTLGKFRIRPPTITVPKITIKRPSIKVRLPEVKKPSFNRPKLHLPELKTPKVQLPKIHAPKIKLPKLSLPKFNLPKVKMPKMPKVSVPKIRAPKISVPKIKKPLLVIRIPEMTMPKLAAPKIKLPKIVLPKIRLPKIKMAKIRMPNIKNFLMSIPLPEIGVPKVGMSNLKKLKKKIKEVDLEAIKNFIFGLVIVGSLLLCF